MTRDGSDDRPPRLIRLRVSSTSLRSGSRRRRARAYLMLRCTHQHGHRRAGNCLRACSVRPSPSRRASAVVSCAIRFTWGHGSTEPHLSDTAATVNTMSDSMFRFRLTATTPCSPQPALARNGTAGCSRVWTVRRRKRLAPDATPCALDGMWMCGSVTGGNTEVTDFELHGHGDEELIGESTTTADGERAPPAGHGPDACCRRLTAYRSYRTTRPYLLPGSPSPMLPSRKRCRIRTPFAACVEIFATFETATRLVEALDAAAQGGVVLAVRHSLALVSKKVSRHRLRHNEPCRQVDPSLAARFSTVAKRRCHICPTRCRF